MIKKLLKKQKEKLLISKRGMRIILFAFIRTNYFFYANIKLIKVTFIFLIICSKI